MKKRNDGQLIGLIVAERATMLIGLLGILKSGNAFVPIRIDYPDERIDFIIQDCGIEILVAEEQYQEKVERIAARNPMVKRTICIDAVANQDSSEPAGASSVPATVQTPQQLCYVIFTSGSTGVPKGVPISHSNLTPLLLWSVEQFKLNEETRVLQNLSYAFDFGVFELLTTVLFGGTLYFLEKGRLRDLSDLTAFVAQNDINTIHTTPSFFREILALRQEFPSLKTIHLGGEELTGAMLADLAPLVGKACVVYNGYGPTEASVNCALFEIDAGEIASLETRRTIPIGKPSANNTLFVLDQHLNPVPVGVPGELHVGGPALAAGYLKRPGLTAEKFIPHPFSQEPGARLYKTGDLVRYLPDGNIEFLGRIDQQVKIRGYRVEPGEIEATLLQHPSVREAVVLARAESTGDKRLVAYLVPEAEEQPQNDALYNFLKGKLPDYMLPAHFIALDTLPLTPNGKLDRQALPVPDVDRPDMEAAFVAPTTPEEKTIAAIWSDLLGIERIGIHDNFFQLGGHSLMATQLISRINEAFQVDAPLLIVFESPTIAELSATVLQMKLEAVDEETAALLLNEINQLSEEEVDRLFEEMG